MELLKGKHQVIILCRVLKKKKAAVSSSEDGDDQERGKMGKQQGERKETRKQHQHEHLRNPSPKKKTREIYTCTYLEGGN